MERSDADRMKEQVSRSRHQARADLERQLKASRREVARVRERLVEAMKRQTATSEMLRIISDSPIQSVLEAVAEHAARLCDSNDALIYRVENNLLRLAASYGEIPIHIQARVGFPVNRDRVIGRAAFDRRTVHVHDLAAEDREYPSGSSDAKRQGHRTTLATPLLRDRTPIGVIGFRRWEVRPFSDNQIALLEAFADEAAIAIEHVRLFEAEKQRTLALAQANRDLRQSEAKFRDYAETASDWFWEIGPDYKFTLLTENAFGSGAADQIGTTCWDRALDLETEPEKWRLVWATLDARKPFRDFVYRSLSGSGSPMYVRLSGKPVFDVNGEFRGYRGTSTDVSAIMRAREVETSLQEAQTALMHVGRVTTLGQLTASITHEVTQPIASARNNARAALNFLERQPSNLSEVKEALDCAIADCDRTTQIVDRIRDHIKKAPPRKVCFDLNKAINEVLLLARSAITENGVSVQTNLTEGALSVEGDRVQVQQVILNLILNAVEAMGSSEPGARELLIGTEQKYKEVLVAVRDAGPGIDPQDRERVFQPFYTTKSSGVGMGLAICRSIINAHGGRLWADANEYRGAVLRFTLPSAGREFTTADQTREPHEGTV
jgi:signal transduction histidine kinase/putative methionine-R-sulfoxide reductase with GAF domain